MDKNENDFKNYSDGIDFLINKFIACKLDEINELYEYFNKQYGELVKLSETKLFGLLNNEEPEKLTENELKSFENELERLSLQLDAIEKIKSEFLKDLKPIGCFQELRDKFLNNWNYRLSQQETIFNTNIKDTLIAIKEYRNLQQPNMQDEMLVPNEKKRKEIEGNQPVEENGNQVHILRLYELLDREPEKKRVTLTLTVKDHDETQDDQKPNKRQNLN